MKRTLVILSILSAFATNLPAQSDFSSIARLDKTVHDFGDITMNGGAVSCSYTLTNISDKTIRITSVISSCGCTDVNWSKADIAPGAKGTISATYKNEDGPYPFDKTLTVYVSFIKKPIILHLKGVVRKEAISIEQSYPVHYGNLALRSSEVKVGNLSQGEIKGGEITVANIGRKPITISFKDVSENLTVRVEPSTIAAGATGRMIFNVKADRKKWGKNWYYATPLINGKEYKSKGSSTEDESIPGAQAIRTETNPSLAEGSSKIGFWAITKENFANINKDQREVSAKADFKNSTFSYGQIEKGTPVQATFEFTNTGKDTLRLYKIEPYSTKISISPTPAYIAPGKSAKIKCKVDTSEATQGENLFIINVYSNSPSNPIIYLYITGYIR